MRLTRWLAAAALLGGALGLPLAALAQSNDAAQAPWAPKAIGAETLRMAPGSIPAALVRVAPPLPEAIESLKRANRGARLKFLEIGIGREVEAHEGSGASLTWVHVAGGSLAHWRVSSSGAKALRVALDVDRMPVGTEIRFAESAGLGRVYGPVGVSDVLALGSPYWSPVLDGDTATIELYVPGPGGARAALAVALVSHLFVSPSDPNAESLAKAAQFCEVDFICRSPNDAQLAQTGRSVARMTLTTATGGSGFCTGTLLNPSDNSFAPYFFTAAHCISTQSTANTLTTHWFYEATSCGGSAINPANVQLPGGATMLFVNVPGDAVFLRLNGTPPSGAVYAGWDAATVSPGNAMTAIHHPDGDLKKVSLGTSGGFESTSLSPGGSFLKVSWNSISTGVTEPGSSGSGIFSGNASAGYRFRGGLLGGPSSCTAAPNELFDYYSRFDQHYSSIAQYLNPAGEVPRGPNVLVNPGFESGRTGWTESSSGGFALITNNATNARAGSWYALLGGANNLTEALSQVFTVPASPARLQFYLRITTQETVPSPFDVLTVSLVSTSTGATLATLATFSNVSATSAWGQSSVYDISAFAGQSVRLQFRVTTDSSLDTFFAIDDVSVTGAATGAANYTALWWNAAESGWGLNATQQGNIVFATLFTYDSGGAPMWLVMSNGARQGSADTFSGELYRTTGPVFNAVPFTPINAGNVTQVGTMTLAFSGANAGTLTYTVNGVSVTKSISKQVYGAAAANCQSTTGSRSSAANYQDLWWNAAESGWGLNITHQGNTLFGTLFSYGSNNQGLWLVMSAGQRQGDGSYLGELYRVSGPPFNAQPWPGVSVAQVGTMRLRFSNGENGTLEYSVNGANVTKAITRQVFSTPLPLCN